MTIDYYHVYLISHPMALFLLRGDMKQIYLRVRVNVGVYMCINVSVCVCVCLWVCVRVFVRAYAWQMEKKRHSQ